FKVYSLTPNFNKSQSHLKKLFSNVGHGTSDCSIPFSVDDISKSMKEIEVTDVDMPPLIRENSGFTFLH
ncbi:Os03g0686300, partial [Oryza sativa Japonica Group]